MMQLRTGKLYKASSDGKSVASVRNVCHVEKSALSAAYLKLAEQEEENKRAYDLFGCGFPRFP
jgi:hypothetical protein